MSDKQHWEQVYASKAVDEVSWFQPHPEQSLALLGESFRLMRHATEAHRTPAGKVQHFTYCLSRRQA